MSGSADASTRQATTKAFESARADYAAGRLHDAELTCRQVLAYIPDHAEAWHLLGLIARQVGRNDIAVECFGKAIAVVPTNAAFHNNLGNALKDLGRLAEAVDAYDRAIALAPGIAEIHNNLGCALQAQGRTDAAIAGYGRALSLKPRYVEAHTNLGTALFEQGRFADAVDCHRRALSCDGGDFAAHSNLGNALQAMGRPDEAEASYRQALAIDRAAPEILNNLGSLLQLGGRLDEAIACFAESLSIRPDSSETLANLGNAFTRQGRRDDAAICYGEVLRLDPDNRSARHLLTALQGGRSEAPPREYVETLFDDYAEHFDQALVGDLGYRTPAEIVALLRQIVPLPEGGWEVLDLGCGTGLVGVELAAHAGHLVGVDLSAGMLARAGTRGLYQRLVHADLLTMMQAEADASYDLVVAADVFVYLGRLDAVVAEARRLLRPGGSFVFSVESLDALGAADGGYRLNPSGRYAHAAAYLAGLATATGFRVAEMRELQVRLEKGVPVQAWLAVWRR